VRTFLLEVLCRAGYNVLPSANVEDAAMLLKMTKAKLVILGANMRSARGKPTQEILAEIDPSVSLLMLDEHFSEKDPAAAATSHETSRKRSERSNAFAVKLVLPRF
jgi:hypothetical protein